MLFGQDRRRHEHERLPARLGRLERRPQRDLRLAVADVAADEAVHGLRSLHVVLDVVDRLALVVGLLVGERVLQTTHELAVGRVREARDRLAGGVELQQLPGHLDDRPAGACLDRLPVRAAELVERRGGARGAHVAADLADLVVRHEDPVVAAELEQQIIAGDAGHGARLDSGETGDAVVLVDHVIAGAHVEEGGQPRAGREAAFARRGAEERPFVDHGELEVLRHEPLAQGRGEEVEAGARLPQPGELLGGHDLGRDVAQPVRGSLRLTCVPEDHEHAVVVVDEARQVPLGAGQVAGGELRTGGGEPDRLVARHDVELRRPCEEGADVRERQVEPLAQIHVGHGRRQLAVEVGQGTPRLVGVEHRPGEPRRRGAVAERGEMPGQRRERAHRRTTVEFFRRVLAPLLLPLRHRPPQPVDVLGLRSVRLEGGEHGRRAGLAGGALRVDGEGPQTLDLVTPELDPQGVAERRIDVDESAPHGELPSRAHLLHALVPELHEARHGGVETDLRAWGELQGAGLQGERQEPFEQGDRLRHHHASGVQLRERPLTRADHMGGRGDRGAVQDAARGDHRDGGIQVDREIAGETRRGLGVRRDHHTAAALLGHRRRQHVRRVEARRVRRRAAPQPRRVELEPLVVAQILEEHPHDLPAAGAGRSVHDHRRSPGTPNPRAPRGGGACHSSRRRYDREATAARATTIAQPRFSS